ncbi:MAG: uroporphyrinogen-III C-methyltransferase [Actinomycetes bacterium]
MSPDYPLLLDLAGRRVLVVGGGPVAARRASLCVQAGALVDVVAPALCEDLADLAAAGSVQVALRGYEPGDVAGAWLVHTCTGDAPVDEAVAADADAQRVWCVRAGDADSSSAWVPAVARVDDTTVAVSAGGDPRRARAVRDAVRLDLETGALPLRRHRPGPGRVSLVGGGPGDPGLVTTRGRRLLAEADVVVVDRLAPRALLDTLDPDVEVVDAGKAPDRHALSQEAINRVLVEHAQAGRHVVRLKGGDPFVLGRGGEEVTACREAGVPVEVVPGVTSAFAVPAAAGVPVTHRGIARSVTVATGHDALDSASLGSSGGTLVLLMAVGRLAGTTRALVRNGRPPSTPVAIVESGFSRAQRTTVGDLTTIAARAEAREVRNPAVVVVGDVARFAEEDR